MCLCIWVWVEKNVSDDDNAADFFFKLPLLKGKKNVELVGVSIYRVVKKSGIFNWSNVTVLKNVVVLVLVCFFSASGARNLSNQSHCNCPVCAKKIATPSSIGVVHGVSLFCFKYRVSCVNIFQVSHFNFEFIGLLTKRQKRQAIFYLQHVLLCPS